MHGERKGLDSGAPPDYVTRVRNSYEGPIQFAYITKYESRRLRYFFIYPSVFICTIIVPYDLSQIIQCCINR